MAQKRMIAYLNDGTWQIVMGWDIFRACKAAQIPSKSMDFYTDQSGPRYVWNAQKKEWERGEDPLMVEKLAEFKEKTQAFEQPTTDGD